MDKDSYHDRSDRHSRRPVTALATAAAQLHVDVAVLEVRDKAQFVELASDPKIRRYLLARLSDQTALVDPGAEDALTKALLAEGQTPRLAKGAEQ